MAYIAHYSLDRYRSTSSSSLVCVCVCLQYILGSLPFHSILPPHAHSSFPLLSLLPLPFDFFQVAGASREERKVYIEFFLFFLPPPLREREKGSPTLLFPPSPSLSKGRSKARKGDRKGKLFYLRKEGGRGRKEPGRSREKCLHSVWRRRERSPREPARVYRGTEGENGQKE